jgi:hypothetical protein
MRYIIDKQAFIWYAIGDRQLSIWKKAQLFVK